MKTTQAQPIEYDGQVWPSVKALERANGVCNGSVHKALARGHWHGKPIRRVDRDEARGITPDQRAEHDAIEALLAKCSDGVQGRWRAAG